MARKDRLRARTEQLGLEIFQRMKGETPSIFNTAWWNGRMMEWCMRDEAFKIEMFRFVDVLPQLSDSVAIARHLKEYFCRPEQDFPAAFQWGLKAVSPASKLAKMVAKTVNKNVNMMAASFIAGVDAESALSALTSMRKRGVGFTVDLLGEATVSEMEASAYLERYLKLLEILGTETASWEPHPVLDRGEAGSIPRNNISIKLSALYSQADPMDWERSVDILVERVRPIFRRAKALNTFCNIDMEHYALKGITLDVFKALIADPEFSEGPQCGVVIQAYLKDSADDLDALLAFCRKLKRPITVRLVKGAYWDYEVITARQHGWEVPVYEDKSRTDENYERLTDLLLSRKSPAKVAIGSHNIRSIAHAMARAESEGVGRRDVEFQMIYGMAEPIKGALVQMGYRVRDYVPIGELIPGMSYLVRRLLENTSNESFLRSSFVDSASPEKLLESPSEKLSSGENLKRVDLPLSDWGGNLPLLDFRHKASQAPFGSALNRFEEEDLGGEIPVIVAGETRVDRPRHVTLYPGDGKTVVARTALAQPEDVLESIERARRASVAWSSRSPRERADVLRAAAGLMVKRRLQLSALQVYEVGKSWQEADADVCEAVDFLRYYAFEMERLSRGVKLGDHPGEFNLMGYRSRGVGAVIAPWNFPLAIITGMASAALVAGNGVLLKPAEQSPGSGFALYQILIQAGVPRELLHFLPGIGHEIGPLMVDHPEIDFIAFTGSREVGLDIIKRAAIVHPGQRNVKQVIAEMGGKNAVIIDDDADLDEAVLGVSHSAFGFQGQKCSACSRVIVVGSAYDAFVERFVESTKSLTVGVPTAPGNQVNAVIDKTAFDRINETISRTATEVELAIRREVPDEGYFVGPSVFIDANPDHAICQEEIFGPVVAIARASSFEEALSMANGTQYALTGGVFSRSPGNIDRARREFDVGNLYINRGITGALVGRQAFGGHAMSGVGSKAGGPDYLLQFLHPRVITENTMRRGFSPETV